MQADGFNKSMYHRLTTLKLTEGFSLMVSKLLLKINSPTEKMIGISLPEPECCTLLK